MTARGSAKKHRPGERVAPHPDPKLRPPEPGSGCSTPELASGMSRGLLSALRELNRKREGGRDDDRPKDE